jgi:DNA-binding transcriptional MerR regulator
VSGQRRYTVNAVQRLAVLRLAQACGFRLDEMRHLLHDFETGVKPPRRWQELARRKQEELDEQMSRLKSHAAGRGSSLAMSVLELPECGRIAASVMEAVR